MLHPSLKPAAHREGPATSSHQSPPQSSGLKTGTTPRNKRKGSQRVTALAVSGLLELRLTVGLTLVGCAAGGRRRERSRQHHNHGSCNIRLKGYLSAESRELLYWTKHYHTLVVLAVTRIYGRGGVPNQGSALQQ